jgi:imidazolonepropionase-like amidohydrolase
MRNLLLFSIITSITCSLQAQQTTFKTNGPDDYREGKHAFTNATVFVAYNKKIDSATLYIQDGKVVKVQRGNIPPASYAEGWIIHNMEGKFIYPSFIDIFSDYGMPEVQKRKWSEDPQLESNIKGAYGWNQAIHTDFHADRNFTVNEKAADELRKIGFGAVLTNRKDGIARGTGAVVTLNNEKENFVTIKPDASAHYSFNKGSSTQDYPSSLMGSIALLRQTYYDADWYKKGGNKQEFNINLDEWNKQQSVPQIFDAGGDWQKILRADLVGDEFGVQYIIKSNGDEYQRIDEIKKSNAKIITSLNFPKAFDVEDPYKANWVSLEEMKHWELAPTNTASLNKAGIDFAFTTSDLEKKDEFLALLRKAVKYGLDSTVALKALTFNPAMFINVYDKVGSLEAGKLANFFITSKPVFDDKCEINENWIQGKRFEIKAFEPKDIRGEYKLEFKNENSVIASYNIKVSGDVNSPKASFNDSSKTEIKLSYKENDVSLSFNPDKKTEQNKIRLNGSINHDNKTWLGKGQLANGEWISWNALQTKAPEADTSKPKKDSVDLTKNLGSIIFPFVAYGNERIPSQENYLIKNGTVWTNEAEGNVANTDIIIRNGKISAIGKNLSCADCKIVDATGKFVTSGIIDEHNHIAIQQGVNEGTESSSAEVRIGDVVSCEDINIYRQLAGGVIGAQLLHGSANAIGGQSALVKFRWGYTPEKMKIEGADGFIKFALGENVKQSNWGDKSTIRYPQTRMGVEQTYYNYFTKAKEYNLVAAIATKGKTPVTETLPVRKDLELDALKEIIERKRFITCHSYVQSEINMLMHVADSFGFKVNTFTHILEGYKVADKMKAHGVNASTFSDWWAYKYEVIDAIPYNAAILTKMGINTAINSDDAEMARRLNQEAAKAIKYGGLSETETWKTVTLNPAKMLHLDKQTGSIKVGKDADIVVWSDNPLSIYAKAEKTFVDGILFFDEAIDLKKREEIRKERARLIQKMLDDKKGGGGTQEPMPKGKQTYSCGHEH